MRCMSVDNLADPIPSTDGLDIIDLDSPLNPPRHLRHGSPWLVADVQWSPMAARDYWVVSTANQKALVWNLNMKDDMSHGAIEHTLHGHTRAITDINFSAHHPDMLATCAVDGYVHCWDLRRPRQPVLTFCDWFAGATQVKYNRQDSHILASSHDRWLRIWDDRKGATPLRSINAHESKIYGIDWSRTRSEGIVTCSLDKTIKFWNYDSELDFPDRIIRTDFPVWRARHTPFGWGLLAMPQDSPGDLHLYERRINSLSDKDSKAEAVTTFTGHGNFKVKEFLWRTRGGITEEGIDNRDFQLVSWGEDNRLRLHRVDPKTLEAVGHVKGKQGRTRLNVTRAGAVYKTFRAVDMGSSDKKNATITGPRLGVTGLKISGLSAGMGKMVLPRSIMMTRTPTMKARAKPGTREDQSNRQIGWMSGIKFNKKDSGTTTHKRTSSRRLSLLAPEFSEDGDWDAPESLADEIIRIHNQLPKITFDDVNIDKGTVTASMNGPWGDQGSAIYIKATISFPDQYPGKAATFVLGKTSLMSEETYSRLRRDVNQIATGFVTRKQGCMEAALCYLLGEVDLEQSTTFFNDDEDVDDDLDGLADESSSDDEDGDIPVGTNTMMSQGLDSSVVEDMLPNMSRNVNVPMPRMCGARFSPSGLLACFFPPKEDKVKSLLGTLVAQNMARNRGEPAFENFGRLNNNISPIPRGSALSLNSENRDDSEYSDDSDVSSSSDSDSSRFRGNIFPMTNLFPKSNRHNYIKATSTIYSHKSSGGGTGTGTGTGFSLNRRSPKPKNIVSLYDTSHFLPAKKELAREYAIFGPGSEVCEHNAVVAEKYSYNDLADIWRYAAILLSNEVPLEVLDQSHRAQPILVIAKDSIKRYRRDSGSDSGIDTSYDFGHRGNISGRVKWGTSPLAMRLIGDLFTHFEKTADLQMLAMLSCVFNEPILKDATSQAENQTSKPQTPLTMKTPAFSLDYFPTDAAAWSMYQRTPIHSAVSTPKLAQTPSGLYGSYGSSTGLWSSDPASASYSCGETPPLRSNRASSEYLSQQSQSLSTSPENPRAFRRINSSGLASSFALNFPRTFSLASSSPPNPPPSRKRPSPVENMLSSLATSSAITWGNTTVLGSVKEQSTPSFLQDSDDECSDGNTHFRVCTGITMTMENQNIFDDEGCMSSPLLNPSKSALYANYRRTYAELLYSWKHPLARLEILKFNGLKDYFIENDLPDKRGYSASIMSGSTHTLANEESPPSSPIFLGKKDARIQASNAAPDHHLDVTGYCQKHDIRLDPLTSGSSGGAVGRCERCKLVQRQLKCTICLEPVGALYTPCLSCGCVAHEHCLHEYHSFGDIKCPGGCDCECGTLASAGKVDPNYQTMISEFERLRLLDAQAGDGDKETLDEEWQIPQLPGGGLGIGQAGQGIPNGVHSTYSTLSKRLGKVRSGDWGIHGSGTKKPSSLRNFE